MPSSRRLSRIGFLINPVAGMGGAVGLKGTDGLALEAEKRGAKPLAGERAKACLRLLKGEPGLSFLTASGEMGERALMESGLGLDLVYRASIPTTSEDTRAACRAFIDCGADLILFCGGDGTARDVASEVTSKTASEVTSRAASKVTSKAASEVALGTREVPILGIPAGVKMHSGVFAVSPEACAELVRGFSRGDLLTRETEIVDVDEELYRRGELQTRLYATARTPYMPALVQERKQVYASPDEEVFKDEIALFASEFMRDGSPYILGAGTTTSKICERLGLEKTLLGVDVVKEGEVILKDASERDLLDLLEREGSARIIVSPIGAQGFILGRGSQQISARVIRRAGIEGLIIVATPHKLRELPCLLVDSGDADLDRALSGRTRVVTGYRIAQLKDVKAASECG